MLWSFAIDISQQIERDISAYLLTITIVNALVGAATASVTWATRVGDQGQESGRADLQQRIRNGKGPP